MKRSDHWVLGINASHNGSSCLMRGARIVTAVQEERLTRRKRDRVICSERILSAEYCLRYAGLRPRDLDRVVVSCQPGDNGSRRDIFSNPSLGTRDMRGRYTHIPHHLAHAYGAYACSGFRDAVVIVSDGVGSPFKDIFRGEKSVTRHRPSGDNEYFSVYRCSPKGVHLLEKHFCRTWCGWDRSGIFGFQSLGGMFSFASYLIFGELMEAGKVMGLAGYGDALSRSDAFVHYGPRRFVYSRPRFRSLRAGSAGWPVRKDAAVRLASSVQKTFESVIIDVVRHVYQMGGSNNLVMCGGTALNCVANELICARSPFKRHFFMPASDDSGVALGAAYWGICNRRRGSMRISPGIAIRDDSCGRRYSRKECERAVIRFPFILKDDPSVGRAARCLYKGQVIGWFEGGSELGPRALGHRSILCDPRSRTIKRRLDTQIKFREPFRPYGASVLEEEAAEWFESPACAESPFMLRAVPVRKGKSALIPAVVHVDGTCRIQTVSEKNNPCFYRLIKGFHALTGVPMVLNTSFNVAGDPLVETPEDAFDTFMFTRMDALFLQDVLITKRPAPVSLFTFRPVILKEAISSERADQRLVLCLVDGRRVLEEIFGIVKKRTDVFSDRQGRWRFFRTVMELCRQGIVRLEKGVGTGRA
ncbi:MAG: carbamoyltransferase [Deltaproteobacteria bacterium]